MQAPPGKGLTKSKRRNRAKRAANKTKQAAKKAAEAGESVTLLKLEQKLRK